MLNDMINSKHRAYINSINLFNYISQSSKLKVNDVIVNKGFNIKRSLLYDEGVIME